MRSKLCATTALTPSSAVPFAAQRPGALDFANLTGLRGEVLEERGLLDVGAIGVPFVNIAGAGWDLAPFGILFGEIPVELLKNVRLQGRLQQFANFLQRRPEVA